MSTIFVTYRRDDTSGHAGRLYDRLADRFGKDNIFRDVDQIHFGDDFVEAIDNAVRSCKALIAIIGPSWLATMDQHGKRRLENPTDFVRMEIESALSRNVPVFPVLVDRAEMPQANDLPESMSGLARRQALEISEARFDYDVGQLIQALELRLGAEQPIVEHSRGDVQKRPQSDTTDGKGSHSESSNSPGISVSRPDFWKDVFMNLILFCLLGWYFWSEYFHNITIPYKDGYVTGLDFEHRLFLALFASGSGFLISLITNRLMQVSYWLGAVFCLSSFAVLGIGVVVWLDGQGVLSGAELKTAIPVWAFGLMFTIWKMTAYRMRRNYSPLTKVSNQPRPSTSRTS
jgi:hypothetical protein